jgi:IS5 family transposase
VELEKLVDLDHSLVHLGMCIDCASFEQALGATYHPTLGAPGISTPLMVALHYLKYQHDLSDENVVAHWVENPYWQHFSGERYFQHRLPIDGSSMTRWRQRLVKMARRQGLVIKQSYEHVGGRLLMQSSRYAHARQMKRARACTRKLRTQLGRVIREIERQVTEPKEKLARLLETAHRIHAQQRHDKNKVYSVHEPEVECIAKSKAGKQYEFGNKVSVAVSSRGGWFVGAKSFTGNRYDGHTLAEQMKQVENLIGDKISEMHVDMGYRGHDYTGRATVHVDKRRRGRTPRALWRWMKRRAAVEPSIGHLETEHRLERNRLKGVAGDAINAILSAAAMNFHKLLGASGRILLLCRMRVLGSIPARQLRRILQTQPADAGMHLFQDRLGSTRNHPLWLSKRLIKILAEPRKLEIT